MYVKIQYSAKFGTILKISEYVYWLCLFHITMVINH